MSPDLGMSGPTPEAWDQLPSVAETIQELDASDTEAVSSTEIEAILRAVDGHRRATALGVRPLRPRPFRIAIPAILVGRAAALVLALVGGAIVGWSWERGKTKQVLAEMGRTAAELDRRDAQIRSLRDTLAGSGFYRYMNRADDIRLTKEVIRIHLAGLAGPERESEARRMILQLERSFPAEQRALAALGLSVLAEHSETAREALCQVWHSNPRGVKATAGHDDFVEELHSIVGEAYPQVKSMRNCAPLGHSVPSA